MARLKQRNAFSLVEVMVYGFLTVLVLGLLLMLFRETRRLFGVASGTFLVDRSLDSALMLVRQDLAETSLSSIRVYPGPPGTPGEKEGPGLTMAGAGGRVTPEGVPRWDRHVFYRLRSGSEPLTGDLVRWERPIQTFGAPLASALLPSLALPGRVRVVVRGIQLPDTTVKGVAESAVGPRGGFQVTFLRQEKGQTSLSPWNPAEVSLGRAQLDLAGNTNMVDLEMRVYRAADSVSAAHYAVVRCRMCPRTLP